MMGGSHKVSREAGLTFSGSARFNKLKRKGREVLDYKCRRNAVLNHFWQQDTGASTVESRNAGHLDGLKPSILGGIIKDVGKWCFKPPRLFSFFFGFSGDLLPVPLRTAPASELAIVITTAGKQKEIILHRPFPRKEEFRSQAHCPSDEVAIAI